MKLIFERSVPGRRCSILPACDVEETPLPESLRRAEAPVLPELSEQDLSRHYTELNHHVHGVNCGFYPLGSCTMKYNPRINEEMAALPGFTGIHPLAPAHTVQGCRRVLELAQQLTTDNLDEAMDGLAYEVADTFLEELDEDNIRVRFRELMTNSIFYTLSRRCGQEPMDMLDDDDFIRIVDFNKLPVLSFLGNAVSEQCEAVLFDIGREMRKIYKKEITQQLEKSVDSLYNTNTDFSTLKYETEENTTKGGQENGVDVLPQGRLSVPESGREGRASDHREVRDAAQDVPEREPKELVSEYADERQAEPASGADRGSSGEPGGNLAGQPEREVPGTEQGEGLAGMGSAPEQPDGDGRGNRLEGIGVQLTETTTEQDLSEAEEKIASAFSFPDLPTVEQQIRAIEAPIRARYTDEIALNPEVVDEILRTGSNRSKGQLRLIYNFMVEKSPEEYTEFVKNEYGTGGKGFEIDGAKYAVWFDDLGLRIAAGDTAKGGTIVNAFLPWEDVSNRIHELLRQCEYTKPCAASFMRI